MMFDLTRKWPRKTLLRAYRDNTWYCTTWTEFGRMTASCARHLRAQGIAAGDRVVICAENRPDYPIAEVALMAIRAVPVPTYTTNTIDDHAHILRDSGARAAIVSSRAFADRIHAAGDKAAGLDLVLEMGSEPWNRMLADRMPPDDIIHEAGMSPATAMACIIYTSGTGGAPRGVMLPHRCILSNCRGAFELVRPLHLK